MTEERRVVLGELAARLARLELGRPVRIAVDGRTASGKTTLADEIADLVRGQGRTVIRTSIDGFHRPKAERYARGRYSPEGYHYDARDLGAVMSLLLAPLGPGGDRLYRTASFDLDRDQPVEYLPELAPADAVLIVDGTFLQHPELREGWDVTIYVDTSEAVSERRGIARDRDKLGGEETARQLYAERCRPAYDLYAGLCAPEQSADILFDNDDFERPRVSFREGGRLA